VGSKIGERFREWSEAPSYEEGGGVDGDPQGNALHKNSLLKGNILIFKKLNEMKFFKNVTADKIGNFILTVITAFVSTFLMQSCVLPDIL
jgi:hypothetical protein